MAEKDINSMTMVEIARRLADLGEPEKALEAYTKALNLDSTTPEELLEAACAVLQYGSDYKASYNAFLKLYAEGLFKKEIFPILTDAFHTPNVKRHKKRYEKNCKLLAKYPYLFRKDFLPFENLPILFFPYDDNGVLPFYKAEERFDEYTDINYPEVTHYFFRDLSKPIFARDIFSQYELEYLKDNVRRSDWVAKENHIYLHYSDWGVFCSWLSLLDMKPLLEEEKFVFLMEGEESLYPIDFKERFGIDYSQYPVKHFSVHEFHKLIWHTQLGYHNGGDFFNEVMHDHPYVLFDESRLMDHHMGLMSELRDTMQEIADSSRGLTLKIGSDVTYAPEMMSEVLSLKKITLKDAFVSFYLSRPEHAECLDKNSRIVPALFFQPHFKNQRVTWVPHPSGRAILEISGWEEIKKSELFKAFKYIKTFSPMRRPTTSMAAAMRFSDAQIDMNKQENGEPGKSGKKIVITSDLLVDYMLNRSFLVDRKDRFGTDSRLVRFEDAKLNPKATFTALAEFLDIPYTESMTYCSDVNGRDPGGQGFSTAAVYRTYDEFADENERTLLEYALRDAYEKYGYQFHYYDGEPMTKERQTELLDQSVTIFSYGERLRCAARERLEKINNEKLSEHVEGVFDNRAQSFRMQREMILGLLEKSVDFCNEDGDPMYFMRPLELDPELLEQPLYH